MKEKVLSNEAGAQYIKDVMSGKANPGNPLEAHVAQMLRSTIADINKNKARLQLLERELNLTEVRTQELIGERTALTTVLLAAENERAATAAENSDTLMAEDPATGEMVPLVVTDEVVKSKPTVDDVEAAILDGHADKVHMSTDGAIHIDEEAPDADATAQE